MTYRRQIGMLLLIGGLLGPGAAGASITPAERCAASQLTAAGRLAKASLACHATTATKATPPDPCLGKATAAFEKAWAAAETKGGCGTTATVTDAEAEVGGVVAAAVGEITGTPEDALLTTPAAQACAARKLAATGKDGKGQIACDAAAALHATLISPKCEVRATGGLTNAFSAAEALGGCATTGDGPVEQLNIAGLGTWSLVHLGVRPMLPGLPACGTYLRQMVLSAPGLSGTPAGVAVDRSGNVFVADHENCLIWKFDSSGNLVTTWSACGGGEQRGFGTSTDGIFWGGMAVNTGGEVFVGNDYLAPLYDSIQAFTNNGLFDLSWPSSSSVFGDPVSLAVTAGGHLDVGELFLDQVNEFDFSGNFVRTLFSGAGVSTIPGDFVSGLTAAATDGRGDLYVDLQVGGSKAIVGGFGFDSAGMPLSGGFASGAFVNGGELAIAIPPNGNPFFTVTSSYGGAGPAVVWADGSTLATLAAFGTAGTGDGEFTPPVPVGLAVDTSGDVYVGDVGCPDPFLCAGRVEVFSCPQAAACGYLGGPCCNSPLIGPCSGGLVCSANRCRKCNGFSCGG
jgi:hypothetical protein